jgi:hypothetical protein
MRCSVIGLLTLVLTGCGGTWFPEHDWMNPDPDYVGLSVSY